MTRELKRYKGYRVMKETDEETKKNYYWLLDDDDNMINIFKSLRELKKDVDNVWSK